MSPTQPTPSQGHHFPFGKAAGRIGILLVLTATYFVYAPVTRFGFVYDDIFQIVQNTRLDSWRLIPAYFTQHFWAHVPGTPANLYRPLVLIWFFLNNSIFSHEPWGWHLTTLLVHLLVTGLVFALARRLLLSLWPAMAAATLFALHPIQVESVAWVSSVTEPLCAAWFLAAFLCYLRYREHSMSKLAWLASLAFYAAALLTKETAVGLPILLLGYEYVDRGPSSIAPALRRIWPYFTVLAAYLVLRFEILHGLAHRISTVPLREALLTLPSVVWFYIRMSVWPLGMSPLYDAHYVYSVASLRFIAPTLVLLGGTITLGAIRSRGRLNRLWFSVAWFVLTLAPALAAFVAAPKYEGISDRYLYLPSVAVCLLAGLAIKACSGRPWTMKTAYVGFALLMMTGTVVIRRQVKIWENNYSLFQRAVQVAPHNVTAAINLGVELQRRERYNEALVLAQRGLNEEPDSVNLLSLAGAASFQLHRYSLAEGFYQRAIHVNPTRGDLYQCLAMTQIQLEQYADAATALKQGIAASPDRPGLHYTLGKVLSWRNDWGAARDQFRMELALDPENSAVQVAFLQAQAHLQPAVAIHP
ncbi:MAG TPA: hypothetical protein VFA68_10075 [Terriglobales bacterium]|nr:hypothetical protein [Terriglobales bacterium]